MLLIYGCKNCILKLYCQCPKGFTEDDEFVDEGYCDNLVNYLLSFVGKGKSLSALKERFHLAILEALSMDDLREYRNLVREHKRLKAEGASNSKLMELEMQINANKIWVFRLNETITKGHSRIRDRETKVEPSIHITNKLDLTQLHKIINNPKKQIGIEEKDD
jgi:hypothetical protein